MSERENMMRLQSEIDAWQRETFPNGTMQAAWHHLREETAELRRAIFEAEFNGNVGALADELADCQHLLFAIASRGGVNLYYATEHKFQINKRRKWGDQDEHGVVHHTEDSHE